jgi:hypothetical protein
MSDESDRRARAEARRDRIVLRKFRLGQEPPPDLSATTSAEERLAMVDRLTAEVWPLAQQAPAEYTRAETPISRRPWPPSPLSGGR